MIEALIRWSINNRSTVLILTVLVSIWGVYSLRETPVDALPDLSDVQVIIKTSFPGQAPQVVEDQVTYPLTTAMLSVPKAVTCQGLFILRRLLRLHHFRRRHGPLLGAFPGAGIPEPGVRGVARQREARTWPRRDGGRLGVRVRAR